MANDTRPAGGRYPRPASIEAPAGFIGIGGGLQSEGPADFIGIRTEDPKILLLKSPVFLLDIIRGHFSGLLGRADGAGALVITGNRHYRDKQSNRQLVAIVGVLRDLSMTNKPSRSKGG